MFSMAGVLERFFPDDASAVRALRGCFAGLYSLDEVIKNHTKFSRMCTRTHTRACIRTHKHKARAHANTVTCTHAHILVSVINICTLVIINIMIICNLFRFLFVMRAERCRQNCPACPCAPSGLCA